MGARKDIRPTWGEPNWEQPWHQHRDLLHPLARCETCASWLYQVGGDCGEEPGRLRLAEDRCGKWVLHPALRLLEAS